MKQVIAIFPPHRLEAVEAALHRVSHLPGFTLFPARGHSRGTGINHRFVPTEWNPDAHAETVLMMFCADTHVQEIVDAIRSAAHTGNPGDGLVAVSPVESIVRIRSGESGDAAV